MADRDLIIGPLRLSAPVLSAPIAGFTDRIFRGIVRDFGGLVQARPAWRQPGSKRPRSSVADRNGHRVCRGTS